jgi:hypothetical protein
VIGLKGCVLGFLGGVPTFVMLGLNGCGFGAGLGYSFRRSWLVMGVVLMRGIPTHRGLSGASNPSLHWTYSLNVLNLMEVFRPAGGKKKKPRCSGGRGRAGRNSLTQELQAVRPIHNL